ncbi:NACHT and WD repeat domain-containing protein 2 isoform X2 [Parambassis ranga]|uniref:NACHT and WD repeat domain-containing protein 2 isoform X2 n=1 Tax=Parambassis ranga TaxID=210632 RepID=A0A6P7JHJ3_9TELE|nr:NACHT and WD repeat domain-containing protein 2-like isoform X2 [Parambassis ranga]
MHFAGQQSDCSCVKIYLCSNPEDSVVERKCLRECVVPRLREHCRHTLGLDVRLIDPFESSDPSRWPDENTRRQLIEECRESSAGPFLLALVGHQYGTAGLPAQVEVSEYQMLLQQSQQAGISTQELEGVYRRDENTVPTSYCLRPAHRHTSPHQVEVQGEDDSKAKDDELRTVFQTAVSLCVHSGLMTPQRAHSYYRSVLDADLRFAVDSHPDEDIFGRCLVYVHKVVNAKGERQQRSSELPPQPESRSSEEASLRTKPTDGELLSELCDSFLPDLISSRHLIVYTVTTECDRRHGYTTARRLGYAESLWQQVYADLVALTDCSKQRQDCHVCSALWREQAEQQQLCGVLSGFYHIIQPEEEKVRAYVEQRDQQCPLVVTGGPCTGKTVLLAHCAEQMKSWLPDTDPVVISYFCSLSINTSAKRLLSSLCGQISGRYLSDSESGPSSDLDDPNGHICGLTSAPDSHDESANKEPRCSATKPPPDLRGLIKPDLCLSELKDRLSSLFSLLPSTKQPLVLMLNGLDQLEDNVGPQVIQSLPSPLPPNIKIILTVSSNRTLLLQAIKLHYPQCSEKGSEEDTPGYVCVQLGSGDRKECVKMLATLLRSSGRRVTSGQQALVNQALASCCLPLYARLLHARASLWRSDSDVTESSLHDGVHSSVSALLDDLEHKHSSAFVSCALSYLTLSRAGLSEAELADLLSTRDELVSQDKMKVPQVDVETLVLGLSSCLMKSTVADSQVLLWVSRHFKLVVAKRYLGSPDVRRKIHSEMADYFSGNQLCSQPFVFTSDVSRVNLRKVVELPYHLQQSGRWEELERGLLMSLEFHQAMVRAGLLGDLVAMLEADDEGSQLKFLKERFLMASTMKRSACFLQRSPLQLPTVMETSLHLYQEVFPALKGYIRDIRQERKRRGGGLGVALCPSPSSVTPIQYLKPDVTTEDVCVAEAAGTECGVVAEVMDDGSAWVWNGSACDVVKLSLSCEEEEMKFAGVKSSDRLLLLSTQCSKLFLWDVTGPDMFLEVKDTLKTKSQTPNKVEGFVACQKKLYVWWKEESFVSVFDISTETMTHFQCQSPVTCVVANGFFMYCGQEEGTVSIFDIQTKSLLYTCSNTTRSTVTSIILCKDREEMACIDSNGNVALWDVAAKTHPPRRVKEAYNEGKSDQTLSTDYCREINTLLVCQANQVTLWDTYNWELWDQLLAPQGRAFTQAVLSQDGHLLLASLDTCIHILVWRVSTGECVLSLEMNSQSHMLLKTVSDVICVAHDGCLTVWDNEMIDVAGSALKMRHGVEEVLIEESGKWFYCTDGSEMVWRWSLDTGLPSANLLHDGPVEKLRLSPNSVHLVSLSAGEIYVWETESAANIQRICGSRATDILITPNSNCGVSISDRGLSRVWKMTQGSIVCSIHVCLSDAQVSPENTFLIGRYCGDLLAASLWSGSISKRFSCVESSQCVIAFRTLPEQPEFVVVMVASGAVYTWKVAEETVCRHFHLPHTFHCQPHDFQMSSNGSWTVLSTDNDTVHLLDLSQVRLCSFRVDGPVLKACLDKAGCYIACISCPGSGCDCDPHARPVLTVTRLSDGERVGSIRLSKNPLALAVWERHHVFVGFQDGSVGVYSVSDIMIGEAELIRCRENVKLKECPFDRAPSTWLPLKVPNVIWP